MKDYTLSKKKTAELENIYVECGGIIRLFRHTEPSFRKTQTKIKQAAKKLCGGTDYPKSIVDFTSRQSLEFAAKGCSFMTANNERFSQWR